MHRGSKESLWLKQKVLDTVFSVQNTVTGIPRNSQLIRPQRSLRVARNCELRGILLVEETV